MIFLKVKDLSPCLTKKDLKLNLSEWSLLGKVKTFCDTGTKSVLFEGANKLIFVLIIQNKQLTSVDLFHRQINQQQQLIQEFPVVERAPRFF